MKFHALLGMWLFCGVLSCAAAADYPWRSAWPNTDFSTATVDLAEIVDGGPPRDGIPSIDRPRFDSVDAARKWLDPREPVILLALAGMARAYPLQIMVYHEIVNDTLADIPVAVTFCPLCNSAIAFERRVAGRLLDFGTTGLLLYSDMVMYDRQSESWWQQLTGESIAGHYSGTSLKPRPTAIVSFRDFARRYPNGEVLSQRTGAIRPYGKNPYRGYDTIEQSPFLLSGEPDPRLPPMERVIAVTRQGVSRLYPFSILRGKRVINDTLGGSELVIFSRHGTLSALDRRTIRDSRLIRSAIAFSRRLDGRLLHFEARNGAFYDLETATRWSMLGKGVSGPLSGRQLRPLDGAGEHFAFAWLAFRPESEIYSDE